MRRIHRNSPINLRTTGKDKHWLAKFTRDRRLGKRTVFPFNSNQRISRMRDYNIACGEGYRSHRLLL
jgi:hypothetical protein